MKDFFKGCLSTILIAGLCLLALLLVALSGRAQGARLHRERVYQEAWCGAHNGRMEVTLSDRTRVDCVTDEYAVEVDFADKWAEAVGQSMHYANMTDRRPGILLIMEKNADVKYFIRLQTSFYWIKTWTISPQDLRPSTP